MREKWMYMCCRHFIFIFAFWTTPCSAQDHSWKNQYEVPGLELGWLGERQALNKLLYLSGHAWHFKSSNSCFRKQLFLQCFVLIGEFRCSFSLSLCFHLTTNYIKHIYKECWQAEKIYSNICWTKEGFFPPLKKKKCIRPEVLHSEEYIPTSRHKD